MENEPRIHTHAKSIKAVKKSLTLEKPSWLSNARLLGNAVVQVRNSANQILCNVKNVISQIPANEADMDEMKGEVWADLSAIYYKYDGEDQKRAFREVTYEIAEKVTEGKWDTIYQKLYRRERFIR